MEAVYEKMGGDATLQFLIDRRLFSQEAAAYSSSLIYKDVPLCVTCRTHDYTHSDREAFSGMLVCLGEIFDRSSLRVYETIR